MKKFLFSLLMIIVAANTLIGAEYAVVSNKKMPTLTQAQVKAIFLKKMIISNDINIIPINLSPRDSLRINFEKNILKTNFRRLKSYWTSQHYLGHRPPIRMKSQQSAIAFLKKVDGAITYIDVKYIDKDMKIILRWSN